MACRESEQPVTEGKDSTGFIPAKATAGNGSDQSNLAIGSAVRVGRLQDLVSLRAEAARLYREARRREGRYPDALTAQRLASVLGSVRGYIELVELEQRLAAVERRMER